MKARCPRCMSKDVEFVEVMPEDKTLEEWFSCPACGTQFKMVYIFVKTEIVDENGD